MYPKVFVSHASEDKERFVLEFARKLRTVGIDAWLDRWEMLPGDSLVEKIFEEGLKEARAIIIILSTNSVNKRWVKEELNASIMAKLNKGSKIIPVVLDDIDVPESLKSTLWEKVNDTNNYDDSFQRIVASIFEQNTKPALGTPPSYVQEQVLVIPGLTKIDNLILKMSCEADIENNRIIVEPTDLFSSTDIPASELEDALEVLDQHGFIKLSRHLGPGPYHYSITLYGMDQYAKAYLDNYEDIKRNVVVALVNKDLSENRSISEDIQKPIRLVNHILDLFENNGLVKLAKEMGGGVHVYNISPSLKRALR